MKTARFFALLLAGLSLFALAACGSEAAESKEKLIVGTSADYPPFEFHVTIGGKDTIVGGDIELAGKIAEDMGKELEIRDIAFDSLLDELNVGNVDMVISDMVVSDERLAKADASKPYYAEEFQRVVFLKRNADRYTSFEALEGLKLGVQTGSIQVGIAGEHLAGCQIVLFDSVSEMFTALAGAKVDAVLVAGHVAENYVEANSSLALLDQDFPASDGSCVWVAKEDPKGLLDSINKTIDYVRINNLMADWLSQAAELSK